MSITGRLAASLWQCPPFAMNDITAKQGRKGHETEAAKIATPKQKGNKTIEHRSASQMPGMTRPVPTMSRRRERPRSAIQARQGSTLLGCISQVSEMQG